MAEDDEFPSERFRKKQENSPDDDNSDAEDRIRLDLGIDNSKSFDMVTVSEEGAVAGSHINETPKREDNPFSFKHFLRSDTSTNYQNQGARPKVYCDGRPISSISDLDLHQSSGVKQTRIVPEFSSALPDFVQDHLVVEQCYLDKENATHNEFKLDMMNNLPDFAPTRNTINYSRLNGESSRNLGRRTDNSSSNLAIPLDLPVRPSVGFPLDLPIAEPQPSGCRSCPTSVEVGVSKSLPDFLTDGAVQANEEAQAGQSPESEVDRLRQEIELYRQQLAEQSRRMEVLQRQLEVSRNKEHEYTQNLAKALEQVEESLERSNQRTACAENVIAKLRQEIRSLKNEVDRLKQENLVLRGEHGASGGPSMSSSSSESHTQRLAQELRSSASTAEHSLRQLLLGVDNLRMIAATLENMNRIEERTELFSDCEDDAGPAL
ncbi:hypothetical protein ILUMI_01482 [Ignelater luminosus]|uniref:Endosome-associated-trafficking regulator 1 n=1 Tax=Ignelater luminosus TaxID=2038154 RepID=A0A8K0DEC5_IGNLU|nr:hypothetical protein ILUMI_01482 [Ignelater luminosus]